MLLDWIRTHFLSRDDAEFLYFGAQTIIALISLATLVLAWMQVRTIARQALATSLLNLEERWNSDKMRETRVYFVEVSTKWKDEVFAANPNLSDDAVMKKVEIRSTEELSRLMKEDLTGKYILLMRIFGFFEIVGLLVKKGYVGIEDVDLLFRGPILEFGSLIGPHLIARQTEKGVPPGLGENALFLVSQIKQRASSRS
jgi:hypothetical protein